MRMPMPEGVNMNHQPSVLFLSLCWMFVVATGASAQHAPQGTCLPVILEWPQISLGQSDVNLIESDIAVDTSAKIHLAPDAVILDDTEIQLPDCGIRLKESAEIHLAPDAVILDDTEIQVPDCGIRLEESAVTHGEIRLQREIKLHDSLQSWS
jgi:hypothetical protein